MLSCGEQRQDAKVARPVPPARDLETRTFYNWEARFVRQWIVSEAKRSRRRSMRTSNVRSKNLLAGRCWCGGTSARLLSKKGQGPLRSSLRRLRRPRRLVCEREARCASARPRWACRSGGPARIIGADRTTTATGSRRPHRAGSERRSCAISPADGGAGLPAAVRPAGAAKGKLSGINRIYRIYREEGLTVRQAPGASPGCSEPGRRSSSRRGSECPLVARLRA